MFRGAIQKIKVARFSCTTMYINDTDTLKQNEKHLLSLQSDNE